MGIQNTIPLSTTIQWASFLTGNRPLTLLSTNDPALTCANMIADAILAPPFKWAWNRNSTQFLTADPVGWVANKTVTVGYRIVDSNGNLQTVTGGGTTGATVPTWNASIGGTTNDGSVIWTTSNISDYIQSVTDFGFIELATLTDVATGKVWDIPNKTQTLTPNSDPGRWQSIAPYLDDGNGNITFRPAPGIPDKQYIATIQYQKRSSLMASTSSIWPIPDMFQQIYSTGFMGMIWLFADDPRSAFMLQRFAAMVIAVSDGLTDQEKNSFLDQWDMTAASRRAALRANQGTGARSAS